MFVCVAFFLFVFFKKAETHHFSLFDQNGTRDVLEELLATERATRESFRNSRVSSVRADVIQSFLQASGKVGQKVVINLGVPMLAVVANLQHTNFFTGDLFGQTVILVHQQSPLTCPVSKVQLS